MKKKIFGVGSYEIGKYNSSEHRKIYNTWISMLRRCYDKKYHIKKPTYIDCSVDEKWLNFQNFAEWYTNNYIDNFVLDKDIITKNNKIYGPDTCCFVPVELNSLFSKKNNNKQNSLPTGINLNGNNYQVSLNKFGKKLYYGTYHTIDEAFKIYKYEKENHIKNIAEEWKHLLNENVYKILINYNVEITD